MTDEDETKRAVVGYFDAWTHNKPNDARAFLADDLEFIGPTARYESAAAFQPALVGFAAMTRSARIMELIVSGDRAAMLYECELPEPIGKIHIASFFRVERGKIRWYETQFDATELRKLQAKPRS
jgi:hypothetical protein